MDLSFANIHKSLTQNSCCTSLHNAGATGVNWLVDHTKSVSASMLSGAKTIAAVVSNLFSQALAKLGALLSKGRDLAVSGFGKAAVAFRELPIEGKLLVGAAAGIATVGTAIFFKYFKKEGTAVVPPDAVPVDANQLPIDPNQAPSS